MDEPKTLKEILIAMASYFDEVGWFLDVWPRSPEGALYVNEIEGKAYLELEGFSHIGKKINEAGDILRDMIKDNIPDDVGFIETDEPSETAPWDNPFSDVDPSEIEVSAEIGGRKYDVTLTFKRTA